MYQLAQLCVILSSIINFIVVGLLIERISFILKLCAEISANERWCDVTEVFFCLLVTTLPPGDFLKLGMLSVWPP